MSSPGTAGFHHQQLRLTRVPSLPLQGSCRREFSPRRYQIPNLSVPFVYFLPAGVLPVDPWGSTPFPALASANPSSLKRRLQWGRSGPCRRALRHLGNLRFFLLWPLLQDVDQMLALTSRVKPGNELFRNLGDNGELSLSLPG